MSDLREGFEEWALSRGMYVAREHKAHGYADSYTHHMWIGWQAALAYLRQHDGHAEFVLAVREAAVRGLSTSAPWANLREVATLCDAELAKDTSHE